MRPWARIGGAGVSPLLGALVSVAVPAGQTSPTSQEIAHFLRTAPVIDSRPIGKGSTRPMRLTLSDGETTHDAAFQSVDERAPIKELEGRPEIRFADSYHFNIAASALA